MNDEPKGTNDNCLEGFGCPHCMSQGPFELTTLSTARWTDDGIEATYDSEYTDDGTMVCKACELVMRTGEARHRYQLLSTILTGPLDWFRESAVRRMTIELGLIPVHVQQVDGAVLDVLAGAVDSAPMSHPRAWLPQFNHGAEGLYRIQPFPVTQAVMDRWNARLKAEGYDNNR